MVAPLLEVLLLRVLRRRTSDAPVAAPTRLVSPAHRVDSLGHVLDGTTVLLARDGGTPEVLSAGSLVWPPLLGRGGAAYVVVTHEPVDVWMRIGPFETHEGRSVEQVELRMTVSLTDSPAGLADLLEADALAQGSVPGAGAGAAEPGATGRLERFGDRLLERLAGAVRARTADAVKRRTVDELADLSVRVVLDEALPSTFLAGTVTRTALEVVDVDWPTEGRGRPLLAPALAGLAALPPARPPAAPRLSGP